MRRRLSFILCLVALSLFLGPGLAAQESNSGEARLREALRRMTVRVQTAESEAAAARAVQADLEAKNKMLAEQLEKMGKDLVAERNSADKDRAAADARIADRDAELARTKEALEKWKAGHAHVTDIAKKAESARIALSARVTALENRVADLIRKNLALYKLGEEVLTRLENFSYGKALAAREPFIGTTRVRLENEIQGYKDRLLDPKLKP